MAKCIHCNIELKLIDKPSRTSITGETIYEKYGLCPICHNEYRIDSLPETNISSSPAGMRKPSPIVKYGGGFIVACIVLGLILGGGDSSDDDNASPNILSSSESEADSEQTKQPSIDTPTLSESEFKKTCKEFKYKTIARNPEKFIGQNFKVTAQVFSISNPSWYESFNCYYKAYTDDGSGAYFDHMIYIMDYQDTNSDSYLQVLEEDVITFYGTFNGMVESKNNFTGEKSEEVGLNVFYAELVSE